MKALHKAALIGVTLALYSTAASAQLTNQGMLDQVVTEFATRATSWQTVVMNAAMFLFWTLGTISLVFTFGFMALRKADIGEFFAEFIRFILFSKEYKNLIHKNGKIIYATCSILPQENELQIQHFIKNNPDFKLLKSQQLLPTEYEGDGFYMALLSR